MCIFSFSLTGKKEKRVVGKRVDYRGEREREGGNRGRHALEVGGV